MRAPLSSYLYYFGLLLLILPACASSQQPETVRQAPEGEAGITRLTLDSTYNLGTSYTLPDGRVVLDLQPRRMATDRRAMLEIEYESEGGVGRENYRYLRAFAVGSSGDTVFRNLPPIGENTRASIYLELPGGTLEAAGIMKFNGGSTYARTSRERVRVHNVRLVDDLPQPPATGEPADKWLIHAMYDLEEGEILDLGGKAYLLRGQLLLAGLRNITIRNGILYTDRNRFGNRGNRQDFLRLIECENVTVEAVDLYGTRYGDYTVPLATDDPVILDRWLTPHYEPETGPTYRIDLTGQGSGSVSIRTAPTRRTILEQPISLKAGDTIRLYFTHDDTLARLQLETDIAGLVAHPFGSVKHVYANEFSSGFYVTRDNRNVRIRDCRVFTVMGDGFQVDRTATGTRIERVLVNGASRQGGSVNGGINTILSDVSLYNTGRSGLDVEPYSDQDTVRGLTIRNLRAGNHKFSSFIANNWSQVLGLDIDGLYATGDSNTGWKGGGEGARIRDVVVGGMIYTGSHSRLSDIESRGSIELLAGPFDRDDVPYVAGNNVLDGFLIHRLASTSHYLLRVDSTNLARNGLLSAADHELRLDAAQTTTYLRGAGRVEDVTVEDFDRYFRNMVVDERSTRALVTTPSVRVDASTSQRDGGRLTPNTTYYYEVAVIPRGQPPVIVADLKVKLKPGHNSIALRLTGLSDPDNGYVYHDVVVRRGGSPSRYDVVSRIQPITERAGWNNRIYLIDTGEQLRLDGGLETDNRFFGYRPTYRYRPTASR